MRTAIIAAMPREIAELTRGWERLPSPAAKVELFASELGLAVSAGMGCTRVSRAVEAVVAHGGCDRLLSVGLAGACDPALQAGDVLRCGKVVDVRSGERFDGEQSGPILATAEQIATPAEKQRLRESYRAAVVDMEAACVARLARAHGLQFAAIKAISDDASADLRGLEPFVTKDGQFRAGAFALHTALRPWQWREVTRLGRNSSRALQALTDAVRQDLTKTGRQELRKEQG